MLKLRVPLNEKLQKSLISDILTFVNKQPATMGEANDHNKFHNMPGQVLDANEQCRQQQDSILGWEKGQGRVSGETFLK